MAHVGANPRIVAVFLLMALVAALAVSFAVPASHAHADHSPMHHSTAGATKGFTGGWFDGRTVQFFYNKDFFCAQPPANDADSGCVVGEEPVTAPRPGNIPVLYVMTPLGIEVDSATLQCPVAGQCINHPADLDVSPVFGPGTVIPLPPHSHIVDVAQGGWWEIEVIGVTDLGVWNQIVAGKSLATVRALQSAGMGITGDIPSNLYLFFEVQE